MKAKIKVLVSGAGSLLGQGIIRSLRRSSLNAFIIALDPSPLAVGLYWSDARHIIPLARHPSYAERLESILAAERPDIAIPGSDVELLLWAERKSDWERRLTTRFVISDPDVIRIADDKHLTNQFLRRHGFPAPQSCLPPDASQLVSAVGFPLVVKPRIGARSIGMTIARDATELARALELPGEKLIQEHVGNAAEEYTAGTITFDGRCDASVVMRRELRDGNTSKAFVEQFEGLNSQIRRMAEALKATGPANFQFRINRDGLASVFEINARFSGTTPLRALAGLNEVELVVRRLLFGEPVTQPAILPMTILRHFTETALFAGEELRP